MALSWNPYDDGSDIDRMRRDAERAQRYMYEQMRGMQNSQLGRAIGADYASEQKQSTKPVPQPEPNKVLLLLGEDE